MDSVGNIFYIIRELSESLFDHFRAALLDLSGLLTAHVDTDGCFLLRFTTLLVNDMSGRSELSASVTGGSELSASVTGGSELSASVTGGSELSASVTGGSELSASVTGWSESLDSKAGPIGPLVSVAG